MHKASRSIEKVPYHFFRSSIKFQGHIGRKIEYLNPILGKITWLLADVKSLRFDLFLLYISILYCILFFISSGTTPSSLLTVRLVDWNSAMKIFNSTVVSLDTQFRAVSNYVYQHWFHFFM